MDFDKIFIEKLLYPAMELKNGNRIRKYTKELIASEKASYEDLLNLQKERLKELLLHCKNHVPAYDYLDEKLIIENPYKALESVPVLDKAKFNSVPDLFLADNIAPKDRIANLTGGSTGVPTHFYMTREQVERYEAARWRGLARYGITYGSRSVMIWGSHIELNKVQQKSYARKEKILKNRQVIPAFEINKMNADKYVSFLNSYKPEYIYGYASSLKAFAQMIDVRKLTIKLKAVVSTSETLYDEDRDYIASVFNCPVANEYGARDAGILAYTCLQNHRHLNIENAVFEILDPHTLQPLKEAGQTGVLAVTDLGSRAQPRLRWLLGDMITLSAETPDCGINLPVISSIDGRSDSMLVGELGRLIHGHMPNQIIREYSQIRRFQFIQHNNVSCTLILEAEPNDILAKEIVSKINAVEPSWFIEYKFVDEISVSDSGKLRATIREFPL